MLKHPSLMATSRQDAELRSWPPSWPPSLDTLQGPRPHRWHRWHQRCPGQTSRQCWGPRMQKTAARQQQETKQLELFEYAFEILRLALSQHPRGGCNRPTRHRRLAFSLYALKHRWVLKGVSLPLPSFSCVPRCSSVFLWVPLGGGGRSRRHQGRAALCRASALRARLHLRRRLKTEFERHFVILASIY